MSGPSCPEHLDVELLRTLRRPPRSFRSSLMSSPPPGLPLHPNLSPGDLLKSPTFRGSLAAGPLSWVGVFRGFAHVVAPLVVSARSLEFWTPTRNVSGCPQKRRHCLGDEWKRFGDGTLTTDCNKRQPAPAQGREIATLGWTPVTP